MEFSFVRSYNERYVILYAADFFSLWTAKPELMGLCLTCIGGYIYIIFMSSPLEDYGVG